MSDTIHDDSDWGWIALLLIVLLLCGGLRLSLKCSVDQRAATQPVEEKK